MINFNIGIGKMQYGEKLLVRMVRNLERIRCPKNGTRLRLQ